MFRRNRAAVSHAALESRRDCCCCLYISHRKFGFAFEKVQQDDGPLLHGVTLNSTYSESCWPEGQVSCLTSFHSQYSTCSPVNAFPGLKCRPDNLKAYQSEGLSNWRRRLMSVNSEHVGFKEFEL